MRVLADHRVDQQHGGLSETGQVVEGAHGHVDLVTHAADIDQHGGRRLLEQGSGEAADHLG
jgi:hypothetical protein